MIFNQSAICISFFFSVFSVYFYSYNFLPSRAGWPGMKMSLAFLLNKHAILVRASKNS